MSVLLIVGAVWLFLAVLVVALCRTAASADRALEREYDVVVAQQDRRRWAEAHRGRRKPAAAGRFAQERRSGPHDRRVA
jgi:hypothetical protein